MQDWNAALELSRTWTSTYPREAFAFNSLGASLARFGQFEQAVAPMREAMRLDAKLEPPYANLVGVLMALGRFDEARIVLREGRARGIGPSPFRRMYYRLAFYDGDVATTNRMLEASIGVGQTNAAHGWQAHPMFGEVRRAHEQFRRGIQLAVQNGFTEVAGQLAVRTRRFMRWSASATSRGTKSTAACSSAAGRTRRRACQSDAGLVRRRG